MRADPSARVRRTGGWDVTRPLAGDPFPFVSHASQDKSPPEPAQYPVRFTRLLVWCCAPWVWGGPAAVADV